VEPGLGRVDGHPHGGVRRLGIRELWAETLSDDLSLSRAVRRAGLRIIFVPECLVASFESFTWRRLCEFGRRQFLITRVYARARGGWVAQQYGFRPRLVGRRRGGPVRRATHAELTALYTAVPLVFFAGQLIRAVLRQLAMAKALSEHLARLLPAAIADVFGCWLWSILLLMLLLSSAVGRTIRWRGIRYQLAGPPVSASSTRPRVPGAGCLPWESFPDAIDPVPDPDSRLVAVEDGNSAASRPSPREVMRGRE